MGILEATRTLGEEIQKDERFIRFTKARLNNDNDKQLQEKIGNFNTIRMNLERENSAENKDEAKIDELNEQLRTAYMDIMAMPSMLEFNTAKSDMDALMNDINSVIMQCVDGADPKTAEPKRSECSGECSSCGGCH